MKKKILSLLLSVGIILSGVNVFADTTDESAQVNTLQKYSVGQFDRKMEKLSRGLAAVKTNNGIYLSWRLFDSEDRVYGSAEQNVEFAVYKNGEKIATETKTTNYIDKTGTINDKYQVAPITGGVEGEKSEKVSAFSSESNYFDIPLNVPSAVTLEDGNTYSYFPGDASCGDVDGDGNYEIILKWDCNAQDNSNGGYTGNVLLDAYDMETKEFLWRIDLGRNIRGGAHYTQFMVYDLDGDGKAEIACKTAPGSKDSAGEYVTKASSDESIKNLTDEENEISYVNDGGRILDGAEYYTVFDGDGKAIDTIYYPVNRYPINGWGNNESYGNRVDRFLGAIAYLDGVTPSVISVRGYYGRTTVAAFNLENGRLVQKALFDTNKLDKKYEGQGNHNITVADVDGDGKDEVITGALCLDDDLSVLWCSGRGHGDALHIGDYDPTHDGFEYFSVHESGGYEITNSTTSSQGQMADYGMTVYDAATGEELYHSGANKDTGRGSMANIGSGGFYQITGVGNVQANGNGQFSASAVSPGSNFRIFWNGDLYDDILDGVNITAWNGRRLSGIFSASDCVSVNGTKSNPSLSADLFGDWREELVYPTSDGTKLRVFTTTTQTNYKIKTLMHDSVYRSGVAAEQTAYNQPPHVGFYMSDEMFASEVSDIEITSKPNKLIYTPNEDLDLSGLAVKAKYVDGTSAEVLAYTVSGYDKTQTGKQTITITYMDKTATFDVEVKELSEIVIVSKPSKTEYSQGQRLDTSGLIVKAKYADGTEEEINGYTISGYDSSVVGKQTVTITYMDKAATFDVSVSEGNIKYINGEYKTSSSSSDLTEISIGEYSGSFTIEYDVTINSLPANASNDKNSTAGFFVRFMPVTNGVGAGWQIVSDKSGNAEIYWKSTKAVKITTSALEIGKKYNFKFDFVNIGTSDTKNVSMTITNSDGNVVGKGERLDLRNMSQNGPYGTSPLVRIQVYNQATENSTASVTLSGAKAYSDSKVVKVENNNVTINMTSLSDIYVFAVRFENGEITNIEKLEPKNLGESTITASFEPSKVFIWTTELMPINMWSK